MPTRNLRIATTVGQIFICLTIFIAYFQALVDTNFSQKIQKALKSFRKTFALRDSAEGEPYSVIRPTYFKNISTRLRVMGAIG